MPITYDDLSRGNLWAVKWGPFKKGDVADVRQVQKVIAMAEAMCGRSIRSETVGRRPGDPPILIGDARTAHALLGWEPIRSELEIQILLDHDLGAYEQTL